MTTQEQTMLAIVQDRYGEAADVMRQDRVAVPIIGETDVLVRVDHAGVDRGVWHLTTGLPYPVRLAGFGIRAPKTAIRGADAAGTVAAIGASVTEFSVGDRVFGIANGAFAEYAAAPAAKLAPLHDSLTFAQGAALPISGLTALQAVRDRGAVTAGQRVLVIGASGGVGSFAVQIARHAGAHVTGMCSTAKVELVHPLVDEVIDYQTSSLRGDDRTWDVIIDTGGNTRLGTLRRVLAERGTLVIVGAETGGRILGGTDRQLAAMMVAPFARQKLIPMMSSENGADLRVLADRVVAGSIAPVIDRVFPLADAADAVTYVRDGRARGKVLVQVRS
jgi:NADPH:quinone reductase-like Zn-dependent oxidoreductase